MGKRQGKWHGGRAFRFYLYSGLRPTLSHEDHSERTHSGFAESLCASRDIVFALEKTNKVCAGVPKPVRVDCHSNPVGDPDSMRSVLLFPLMFLMLSSAQPGSCADGQRKVNPARHEWWQNAVFYTLYPRSFADSNNDGMGDINGIALKLDYLKKLGIDAIWITPCYPSPQADFGYDVADYENIEPTYGTLKDFDRLQREAGKRGIRILMDFVMNHTSDQHKWFIDSRSSRSSAHRDWYIWRDGKNGGPPNNWTSTFGGSAWKFDPASSQYYYHAFLWQQPDLNWRNPAVRGAMFDAARWWLKRGIAGFRLDAVGALFEDPTLQDNLVLEDTNQYGDHKQKKLYDGLAEAHLVLRDLP
jgi:alpha-glucosidase